MNKDYKMYWYDLDKCRNFLKFFDKTYNTNALENWENLKPLAFKADIWRLCIMYHVGGIYIDATSKCFVPVNKNVAMTGEITLRGVD